MTLSTLGPNNVVVSGLRMRYGERNVLKGVHLTIRHGEVLPLPAAHGADKRMAVEILESFRHRSSGTVQALDAGPEAVGQTRRQKIGIVMRSWYDHTQWQVRVDEIILNTCGVNQTEDKSPVLRNLQDGIGAVRAQ